MNFHVKYILGGNAENIQTASVRAENADQAQSVFYATTPQFGSAQVVSVDEDKDDLVSQMELPIAGEEGSTTQLDQEPTASDKGQFVTVPHEELSDHSAVEEALNAGRTEVDKKLDAAKLMAGVEFNNNPESKEFDATRAQLNDESPRMADGTPTSPTALEELEANKVEREKLDETPTAESNPEQLQASPNASSEDPDAR